MIALDSLALAVLMGLVAQMNGATGFSQGPFVADSFMIEITLTATQTLYHEWQVTGPEETEMETPLRGITHTGRDVATAYPDEATALATGIGVDILFGREIGYLSVKERPGPADWTVRTAVVRSLNPPREEEIRWSLVRGIF